MLESVTKGPDGDSICSRMTKFEDDIVCSDDEDFDLMVSVDKERIVRWIIELISTDRKVNGPSISVMSLGIVTRERSLAK